MKLINTLLIGASIFTFSSCGVGSPESVGEKMAEMDKERKMQKYENREVNLEKEVEIKKFQNEVLKKYGKDEAAMKAIEEAYDKKEDELKLEYEKRKTEVDRKHEDQQQELMRKALEEFGSEFSF